MQVATYTFQCRFVTQAFLPEFKGSTIRGAFGHALKRISCALRRQDCGSCLLFETCAYAFLFEVKKALPFEAKRLRVAQRPHPYVIVPPNENQRVYSPGDTFSFDLILFGHASNYLPHIVYAVKDMGQNGLGSKIKSKGSFEIENVLQDGAPVYSDNKLKTDRPLRDLALEPFSDFREDALTLTCLTPLRLKFTNALQDSLPFHIVIRAALRRLSSLEEVYGDGEPDLDYKGIIARAKEIESLTSDCKWVEIARYSNRQKSSMFFGGLLGQNMYKGKGLGEFLSILKYCETTHLGKQTSFGLGKILVGTMSDA